LPHEILECAPGQPGCEHGGLGKGLSTEIHRPA
jgi:hypothetical protein